MEFEEPEFDGINHKVEEKVPEIKTDIWEKDEAATAAMLDLATAEVQQCKEGVEVLFLKTNLLRDPTSTAYLVTRVEQRAVVSRGGGGHPAAGPPRTMQMASDRRLRIPPE